MSGSDIRFTVSARGKAADLPVFRFLDENFPGLPLDMVDSVFGFVEKCTLYGGRVFTGPQLSARDVFKLNQANIGLRLPLTNHMAEREEYESYRPMLSRYYHPLNSLIVTNDDLARWIRDDYPYFVIEASVIKNIRSKRKLDDALEIYDTVVLPMTANDDRAFLEAIPDKDRIRLFANGGCALTCPSRICYPSISKMNKFKGGEPRCSQSLKQREILGMVDFDLKELRDLGFKHFKLLRGRPDGFTGF